MRALLIGVARFAEKLPELVLLLAFLAFLWVAGSPVPAPF